MCQCPLRKSRYGLLCQIREHDLRLALTMSVPQQASAIMYTLNFLLDYSNCVWYLWSVGGFLHVGMSCSKITVEMLEKRGKVLLESVHSSLPLLALPSHPSSPLSLLLSMDPSPPPSPNIQVLTCRV